MNNNKKHITIQLVPPWNYASLRVWLKQSKILRVIKATMVASDTVYNMLRHFGSALTGTDNRSCFGYQATSICWHGIKRHL